MAASDNLNEKLFHGTAHWFQPGDVISPGTTDAYYNRDVLAGGRRNRHKGVAAYASTSLDVAKIHATNKLINNEVDESLTGKSVQTALFAPVFEVEHLTKHADPAKVITNPTVRRDTKGFRVKGLAGYGVMWED